MWHLDAAYLDSVKGKVEERKDCLESQMTKLARSAWVMETAMIFAPTLVNWPWLTSIEP